ncbi:hypothetical protein CE91St36_23020 [Christensenellaceae bacterium]|uniref:hypothetical protein n=1 Tax=Christensenella TaxID=990721 RepID=UPI0007403573|nr:MULTISPECIES: hypothetical protein [Christensenella]KUJ29253.1 hypothetical protein AR437_10000 [Christensenella hongkongensis]BDF59485.1 hypothetical protein CE91St36_23020 [Christensenellaceae bacterium]BDF62150.1 hypothetical protein CE91St37_23000 [Christensenellaceae bacterium]
MKKLICMLCLISLVSAILFCGCAGTASVQKAIDSKEYQAAREEIEKMKDGAEKDKITDEYEDALFADAAQFLNSKDYVAAHEEAQQSISGKCKEAVEYVTVRDFIEDYVMEGFGVASDILISLTDAFKEVQGGNYDVLNSASNESLEKVTPLLNELEKIPENILPQEAGVIYDYYSQMLLDTKDLCEKTPNAIAENGQIESEYYALVLQLGNYSSEENLKLKIAQALNYFDNGRYILPDEYQQLLNKKYEKEDKNAGNNLSESNDTTGAVSTTSAEPTITATATPEPVTIPLEIEGIRYDTNSIGTPEVYIRVKNTGDVPIDAFDFAVKCLNNYGETVKGYGHEPYAVCTYQGEDGNIGAGEVWSASENDRYWTMSGYDTATKYEVAIIKVHTTDGETITLNQNQYEWIPQNE